MFKKTVCILASLLLIMTAVPLASAQISLPADLDRDNTVGLSDATKLFFAVAGESALTPRETALADLNRNGNVELNEATAAFYHVNGLDASLPEAIDYTADYRDVKDSATLLDDTRDILVFTSSDEWYAFTEEAHEHIENYQFSWNPCDFDTQALLVIPMAEHDRYIASVTADAEHLYVACVTISDPTIAAFDRTAYAFVTISKSDLEGRAPQLINYADTSGVYADPEETILNDYKSLSYAQASSTACTGEHNRPMVFQSVADCDAFISAHLPATDYLNYDAINRLLTDEFAAYDEAFFENHVLLRVVYNASSSGFSIENIAYCATEDALLITRTNQVPMDGDAVLLALCDSVAYVPVLKEHYNGQEIIMIERNRSRHVEYTTAYKSLHAPSEDVVEGSAVLIRSVQELEAVYAAEPAGTPDYTAEFTDTSFENTAYILIRTYATALPTDIEISKIVNNHSQLDVTVDYIFDYQWDVLGPDALSFGRMLIAVPADEIVNAASVKLHERGIYSDRIIFF